MAALFVTGALVGARVAYVLQDQKRGLVAPYHRDLLCDCLDEYLGLSSPGLIQKYQRLRCQVGNAIRAGHYRAASVLVDKALSVQAHIDPLCTDLLMEEGFAADLVALGRYEDAKNIIRKLPAVSEMPVEKENPAPFIAYRQRILGESLLGQGDYEGSIRELQKSVPDLAVDSSGRLDLKLALAQAYLLAGKDDLARAVFMEIQAASASSECTDIYLSLPQTSMDPKAYQAVLSFWLKFEEESIPNLETAIAYFHGKGNLKAAAELSAMVDCLKKQ